MRPETSQLTLMSPDYVEHAAATLAQHNDEAKGTNLHNKAAARP